MDIELNKKQILDAFIHILEIPSISQYEKDVASYIKHRCSGLDIEVTEDDTTATTGSNVGNIMCHIKGTCALSEPIFFTAHMDTIEVDKVKPIIENGYVKTDGTTALGADDKVGIIALLEAVHYLKKTNQRFGDIQLIFTVCEEQGLIGARSFDKEQIKGSFGYTMDADEPVGTLIISSPAITIVTMTVYADTLSPEKSVHETISSIIRSISKHPIDSEVHLSIIGFQENMEQTKKAMDLTIELKSISNIKINSYVNLLHAYAEQLTETNQVTYSLNAKNVCSNYSYTDDDRIMKIPIKAAKEINLPIQHVERLDVSDANIFTSEETPTMNIGVGYEKIHTKEERIPISELYDLTHFIISIVMSVADE